MDNAALQSAMLGCLKAASRDYEGAKVQSMTPVSGGYSRRTYRVDVATKNGAADLILQYLPKGATGLVRVDRRIEADLLACLSSQSKIQTSELIASDLEGKYFDSAAHIFKAETGRPFIETCRNAKVDAYGALNQIAAKTSAAVHKVDIGDLPLSLERPSSWDDYLSQQIEFFRETEAASQRSRPFLRFMAKWLDENRPAAAPLSLVHGDFQVSNMLESSGQTGALLVDWELAHIGDPREDLGWFTMVCGAIPPNILEADVDSFYQAYRTATGWGEDIINPASSAYFLIISSIRTHMGMMKASDALAQSAEHPQSALAAYYMNITTYQHMNWMNAVKFVESQK